MSLILKAGWAEADITPEEKVFLIGQHYARLSEGVMDPVKATALAFESLDGGVPGGHAVMVSCDLVAVSDELREAVRSKSAGEAGLEPENIILSATHTHAAPHMRPARRHPGKNGDKAYAAQPYGIELDAMLPGEYVDFAAGKIAEAVKSAWAERAPSGIGYGVGHAVVGRNRRLSYRGGESRMYGIASDPDFSHVEGYEEHSVYVLSVYDEKDSLKGLVVNVPCPAQVSEGSYEISADFWHETRQEIRKRFGGNLFVLAQCAPSGDQSPHVLTGRRAEERMWRLKGRDLTQNAPRQEIADRIAAAVGDVLPCAAGEIDRKPHFGLVREVVELPRRKITEPDVRQAKEQAGEHRRKYEKLLEEIQRDPSVKKEPRWYKPVTYEFARMSWFENVERRFSAQKDNPRVSIEMFALSAGETAFATNPFELYLDYGIRIRELSPAGQTFLIQLAGSGGYLPSGRSIAAGGYGSVPASTEVGPEGGDELVERTVGAIKLAGKKQAG